MSDDEHASALREGHKLQYGLRTLLAAMSVVAGLCALFVWQLNGAERQSRCIQAICDRGGSVHYAYECTDVVGRYRVDESPVPGFLLESFGEDFFHRVGDVHLWVLLPADWDWDREQSAFDKGCLVPSGKIPDRWERHSGTVNGPRKLITPGKDQLTADDWARAALRQYHRGCDRVTLHHDYCLEALKLDPHNIEANLLLGETSYARDEDPARAYLETVVRHADPESLEHAHAKKLLSGQAWTFAELCDRVGRDGVLR
jgi:hypothetical protein